MTTKNKKTVKKKVKTHLDSPRQAIQNVINILQDKYDELTQEAMELEAEADAIQNTISSLDDAMELL